VDPGRCQGAARAGGGRRPWPLIYTTSPSGTSPS
jgi:hypothetical protein